MYYTVLCTVPRAGTIQQFIRVDELRQVEGGQRRERETWRNIRNSGRYMYVTVPLPVQYSTVRYTSVREHDSNKRLVLHQRRNGENKR